MSQIARFSYTYDATHWPVVSYDDFEGVTVYGEPIHFKCNYSGGNNVYTDSTGKELVAAMVFKTEYQNAMCDDLIAIGSLTSSPPSHNVYQVRDVKRNADIFYRELDDIELIC